MAVAAKGHPAFAAMNVQGFGAGVGRVGPYYEQGNWYRGGAVQMLFITWIYGQQNQVRPMFPPNTSQEDLIARVEALRPRAADAAGRLVEGARAPAGAGHPEDRGRAAADLRRRDAGRHRRPHDPAHAERPRLVQGRPLARQHADQRPGPLVHVVVRRLGRPEPRDVQPRAEDGAARMSPISSGPSSRRWRTAPTRARPRTRSSASATWATRASTTQEIMYGFFDRFLKGEQGGRARSCRRSPTSRWARTSGRRRTRGRRPARSR